MGVKLNQLDLLLFFFYFDGRKFEYILFILNLQNRIKQIWITLFWSH